MKVSVIVLLMMLLQVAGCTVCLIMHWKLEPGVRLLARLGRLLACVPGITFFGSKVWQLWQL